MRLNVSNSYHTTLSQSINASATSFDVADVSGAPTPPFALTFVDEHGEGLEVVYVTGISGDTLTVQRGKEGTSGMSHGAGRVLENRLTAGMWQDVAEGNFFYKQTLYYTSSDTFTKASYPWLKAVKVKLVGGGGAGGGANGTGAGQSSAGSGGAAGGYAESFIPVVSIPASVTVTVGAGGAGVTGGSGTAGGPSSFGSLVVAAGGGSGGTMSAASPIRVFGGSNGATATAGDLRIRGGDSGFAVCLGPSSAGGIGGNTPLGTGGRGGATNLAGREGGGYGAGGGGARKHENSAGDIPGGNGAPGIVIVELYG